jgi:hypothetical protein
VRTCCKLATKKYRGPSPFDYAQGQDDDVKQTGDDAKQPG